MKFLEMTILFFRFILLFRSISKPELPQNGCPGLVVELLYSAFFCSQLIFIAGYLSIT